MWIGIGVLIASLGSCAGGDTSRPETPRHVVLILIDALRADHLGAYGSTHDLTPNLDDLARRGILFENAVAASSWTRPSVAALFTSRHPTSTGVRDRSDRLGDDALTLAESLREAGYQTFAVSTNANAGRAFGFAAGFDRFVVPERRESYPGDFEIHVAEGVTGAALHWVDGRARERPFFLFLHYVDPHDPYLPRPLDGDPPEPAGRFDGSRRQLAELDRLPPERITPADRERIRRLYRGEVRYCDRWIGELLRGFEARGLRETTLWVVTADHGEGLWDHGHRAHGRDLFQEQVHVPLILDPPGRGSSGLRQRRVPTPVSLVDVAPTLLALLGRPIPTAFEGRSLRPLFERGIARPRPIFSDLRLDGAALDSIRLDDLKLIRDRSRGDPGSAALYDLASDPGERVDLSRSRPRERTRLERALDRHLVATSAVRRKRDATAAGGSELDAATIASLRALGYLAPGRAETTPVAPSADLRSALDFSRPDRAERQLIRGFHANEGRWRWIAREAAVRLGRVPRHRRWRVEGFVDLDLHRRPRLEVVSRVDGGPPVAHPITRSGRFVFGGELPPSAAATTTLELECDSAFRPASRGETDTRELCLVVQAIALDD